MSLFGNQPMAKRPVVRKVVSQVPTRPASQTTSIRPSQSSTQRPSPAARPSPRPSSAAQSASQPKKRKHLEPEAMVRRAIKRKAPTPPPQWGSSSDDDEGGDGASSGLDSDLSFDSARKRARSSESSADLSRNIAGKEDKSQKEDGGTFTLSHGADLVSGKQSLKYQPSFYQEEANMVELQYPSASQREKFYLASPISKTSDDYDPMTDIKQTVRTICSYYLPKEDRETAADDDTGFDRRLTRAANKFELDNYLQIIREFNNLVKSRLDDGSIAEVLSHKHSLDNDWQERILDQVCSRTVSPNVEMLAAYKNGSDNVYGELRYQLVSEIFRETSLRSDQVFVDLGSGVGNVVLQAALEVGCESWGCEMMNNPCELADLQAQEFAARVRLWGLSAGQVHLLRGDFLVNQQIGEVLKRADVVLVNNQAFGPDLNSKLVDRFLDLKNGCRIVSLKSFKPAGYEIQERNVGDPRHLLKVVKREYFSNSVSWTSAPGNYFIATKDPSDLIAFQNRMERRARR